MGSECSCLKESQSEKVNEFDIKQQSDKQKILGKQTQLKGMIPIKEENLVLLQSLFRTIYERQRQDRLNKFSVKNTVNRKTKEIQGPMPDYSNYATRLTAQKYGEFDYNYDFDYEVDVASKGPVELDNGAIYIGEWTKDMLRHGKGMQIWADGSKYEGF